MKIPKIKKGIISSMLVSISGPQKDPHWLDNAIIQLTIDNPIIAEYLKQVKEKHGARAAMVGLMVYELIKSQMAADELKELMEC